MLAGRKDSNRAWTALLLTALLMSLTAFVLASPSFAADTDGDGVDAGDCQPGNPDVHPGALDKPDLGFQDTNCDGIDGTESGAVFVATSGSDAATGTKGNPLQTIQAGVNKAVAEGKDVYVAGGTYVGAVTAADNVGVYGGYVPGTGGRSNAEVTTVQGIREAVLADDDQGVVLQLLRLESTPDGGRSTYGLRAINGSTVALVGITSRPGNAAAGANGGTGGTGSTGSPGTAGTVGPSCSNSGTSRAAGGPGGSQFQAGGAGGGGGSSFGGSSGLTGGTGIGAGGGSGGSGGTQNGKVGGPGSNGNSGLGALGTGAPGSSPAFSNSEAATTWAGPGGGTGAQGPAGAGGGGGGGGATGFATNPVNDAHGGGGGGGGGGGQGGGGGFGGGFGGGSFGAYAHNSSIVVANSDLVAGNAGNGGNGGNGGFGGNGGSPGAGGNGGVCGTEATSGGKGGNGGNGGAGGQGGAGGGGVGGPSYGVFATGTTGSYAQRASTLGAGSGGTGGLQGGGSLTRAGNGAAAGAAGTESSSSDFDGDAVADVNDACPDLARGASDTNNDGCPGPRSLPGGGGGAPPAAAAPTPTPRVAAKLSASFQVSGSKTKLKKLSLSSVPAGGQVSVHCKGKGCAFKSKTAKVKGGKTDLLSLFAKSKRTLSSGAVLEVWITKAASIGQVERYTTRKGKQPLKSSLCLTLGSNAPRKTC